MSLRRLLLGRRLANREQGARQIGAFEAVPAMGLDGLASAAYGPEAALTILLPVGAAGLAVFGPIIAAIVVLLLILFASYWQRSRRIPATAAIAFAPAGHDLVSGAADGSLLVTRDDRDPIALPTSAGGIDAVGFLVDGRAVASDAYGRLRIYDPDRAAVIGDF